MGLAIRVSLIASICGLAVPALAETVWLGAGQSSKITGPLVQGSAAGVLEQGQLGEFLVSPVCVEPDKFDGGEARFALRVEKAGRYFVWGRMRLPTNLPGSFAVGIAGHAGSLQVLAGKPDSDGWQWQRSVSAGLDLPAGQVELVIMPSEVNESVFRPNMWRMARPEFAPRLNLLCLSTDTDFTPNDELAARALGVAKTVAADDALRVAPVALPAMSADAWKAAGKQPIPDWLRCPRFFTKDSWRFEIPSRKPGDIASLVRQVAANQGSALRLSGYWGGDAFYPSRVTPTVPGLGSIDFLREAVEEGQRLGIKIVFYINPNALYVGHPLLPEVVIRQPDGQPSTLKAYGNIDARYVCTNHPRYREFLTKLLDEAFRQYPLDGLYVDGLTPHRCFCEHCRAKYEAMFHEPMPVDKLAGPEWAVLWEMVDHPLPISSVSGPQTGRYVEFLERSLMEATRLVAQAVRAARPSAAVLFHSWPKASTLADYDATLTEVYVKQPWQHSLWKFGELANASNVFPIPVLFNIYLHDHGTEAEARLKAWQGLAAGCYPNYWNVLGMRPVFDLMRRRAEWFDFARSQPAPWIALVRGVVDDGVQSKLAGEKGPARGPSPRFLAPYVGCYSALVRGGLPVVTLARGDFHRKIDRFRVLCLANEACLSDAQAEAIRKFVAAGGCLVATHQTSFYDELGRLRDRPALADLFGMGEAKLLAPRARQARFVAETPGPSGPPFADDEPQLIVTAGEGKVLAFHEVSANERRPAALVRQFGKGRVVYLPDRLDAYQCRQPAAWIEQVFRWAVEQALGEPAPLRIDAPAAVSANVFDQPDRRIVHLVNLNGDTHYRSDAIQPIGPVRLRVELPRGRQVAEVQTGIGTKRIDYRQTGAAVELVLPKLDEYEVIAIDLAPAR